MCSNKKKERYFWIFTAFLREFLFMLPTCHVSILKCIHYVLCQFIKFNIKYLYKNYTTNPRLGNVVILMTTSSIILLHSLPAQRYIERFLFDRLQPSRKQSTVIIEGGASQWSVDVVYADRFKPLEAIKTNCFCCTAFVNLYLNLKYLSSHTFKFTQSPGEVKFCIKGEISH